jgi:hypothetical protein
MIGGIKKEVGHEISKKMTQTAFSLLLQHGGVIIITHCSVIFNVCHNNQPAQDR